ncbi:expressed protein [Chlorella variabilis]|uniref:Expressed protein n=1 Tax=Chlorella variabilis TaxID=554065 RepID=E1Z7V6_CHLVA|nr:expressed protein [Chlorella variabilis]EFN58238.1 expressed protein [Chlorella variabilis]|eukprot:XP_005850340.1 expressed protein [Chlorella variabilis]
MNAAALLQPDAAAGAAPPRRGPGRPPGIPAWNKGVPHSETHRKRISMKLTQKWKDPEFKRSVSESLTGKQAWNAGQAHDADTVRKMSEAKLGRRQPLATRKRMSQAAMGRSMGEDARAAVGDRFRGQPKSPEHRSKLAAMARRRHAATRVLRAVEAVYSAASAAPGGGTPAAGSGPVPPAPAPASSGPRSPGGGAGAMAPAGSPPAGSGAAMSGGSAAGAAAGAGRRMGAVRAAAYSMGLTGLSDGSGKRLSRTQILNTFKAELREYRTLQEELSTWTAAFREKNNRKPNLVDVQRTGIPWLIDKFKQYVVLRDRLFSDTSVLRGKLQEAIPDPESVRSSNGGAPSQGMPSAAGMGPMNANGLNTNERSALASRFAAVMDYKLQAKQAARPAGAVGGPSAAAGPAAAAAAEEHPLAARVTGSQAPPRVRMAMAAALEYRQQKAQATKAAADAAAAAARASRSPRSSSSSSSSSGGVTAATAAAAGSAVQSSSAAAARAPAAQAEEQAPSQQPALQAAEAGEAPQLQQALDVPVLPAVEVEVPTPAIPTEPCLPWQAA